MAKYFLKKSKKIYYGSAYKIKDAIKLVEKAIKLVPDFADALAYKGIYLETKTGMHL